MTFKQIDEYYTRMAYDLVLTNNSFYTEADAPIIKRKLVRALFDGGTKEMQKVKLNIKYAGTDKEKAARMAERY
jgi:hypothetical protein